MICSILLLIELQHMRLKLSLIYNIYTYIYTCTVSQFGSVTDFGSNGSSGLQVVPLITADEHPIWMVVLLLRLAM